MRAQERRYPAPPTNVTYEKNEIEINTGSIYDGSLHVLNRFLF